MFRSNIDHLQLEVKVTMNYYMVVGYKKCTPNKTRNYIFKSIDISRILEAEH